jgi:hypothetical protein
MTPDARRSLAGKAAPPTRGKPIDGAQRKASLRCPFILRPTTTATISGRNLAHGRRTAGQRALLAADLSAGRVRLERVTATQAALLCGVSLAYVEAAQAIADDPAVRARIAQGEAFNAVAPLRNGLAAAWRKASIRERRDLGRVVGVDTIWADAIEPAIS